MKRVFLLFLCLLLTAGCAARQDASDGLTSSAAPTTPAATTASAEAAASRPVFDLAARLAPDDIALEGLPWLSPFGTAYEALSLTPQDVAVGEVGADLIELIVPARLEPFSLDGYLVLRYQYGTPVSGEGSALTEIDCIAILPDADAYRAFLETFIVVADRPDRPFSPEQAHIDLAVERRQSLGDVCMGKRYKDEALGLQCQTQMRVEAGSYIGTEDIAAALGDPIVAKLCLYWSGKPIR